MDNYPALILSMEYWQMVTAELYSNVQTLFMDVEEQDNAFNNYNLFVLSQSI
jgi:hypothetical protein